MISCFFMACQPKQRVNPKQGKTCMDIKLPADCDSAIQIYINERQKQVEPKKALRVFSDLAAKYPYSKDSVLHVMIRCYQGQVWDVLHESDSAIACYEDVLPFLEYHRDLVGMRAMAYLYTGWAHAYQGRRLTANFYLNKAGNELEDTTYSSDGRYFYQSNYNQPARAALFTEIADFALNNELDEQAGMYIQKALKACRLMGDSMPSVQGYIFAEAGFIFAKTNNRDSSNRLFQLSLPLLLAQKDTEFLIAYQDFRGQAFLEFDQFDSAIQAYKAGLQLLASYKPQGNESRPFYFGLAKAYFGLGQREACTSALSRVHELSRDNPEVGLAQRKELSELSLRNALASSPLYPELSTLLKESDSLYDIQRIHSISDMDAQYSLQKKNARIGHLDKENEAFSKRVAKQNTYLLLTLLLVILLGAALVLLRQWQRRKQLLAERNKVVLEQQLLRSQMEPHFLFNTISVLQSLIRKDEKERSIKYLSQFARLLRISLENSRKELVPLSEELEALQSYLSLQQVRFHEVFTYEISCFDGCEDEAESMLIPPMLIQPFVENAIQHGMQGKTNSEGRIALQVQKLDGLLQFVISDNGSGAGKFKDEMKKSSLSSIITGERLELLSKQSGQQASLHILHSADNQNRGTVVTIWIPFVED